MVRVQWERQLQSLPSCRILLVACTSTCDLLRIHLRCWGLTKVKVYEFLLSICMLIKITLVPWKLWEAVDEFNRAAKQVAMRHQISTNITRAVIVVDHLEAQVNPATGTLKDSTKSLIGTLVDLYSEGRIIREMLPLSIAFMNNRSSSTVSGHST